MGGGSSTAAKHLSFKEASSYDGKKINIGHFRVGRILGKGGFGVVRAMHKNVGDDKGTWYAVKLMKKAKIMKRKSIGEVFNERNFLRNLRHPFICNAYYGFQDDVNVYLAMDLAVGGDLRFHMNHVTESGPRDGQKLSRSESKKRKKEIQKRRGSTHREPFTVERSRWYIYLIAKGLQYLHNKRILHRDLKPRNVLMLANGYLKITDFGLSVQFGENEPPVCRRKSGTSGYRAPEVYSKSHEHGYPSDYFPLGIMLYQFWKTKKPFDKKSDFHKKLSNRKAVPEIDLTKAIEDPNLPEDYVDVMQKLLKLKPEERLGFIFAPLEISNS